MKLQKEEVLWIINNLSTPRVLCSWNLKITYCYLDHHNEFLRSRLPGLDLGRDLE